MTSKLHIATIEKQMNDLGSRPNAGETGEISFTCTGDWQVSQREMDGIPE